MTYIIITDIGEEYEADGITRAFLGEKAYIPARQGCLVYFLNPDHIVGIRKAEPADRPKAEAGASGGKPTQTDDAHDCHVIVPGKACAMASEDGVIIKARDFEADLTFSEARRLVWFSRIASDGEMAFTYAEADGGQDGAVMLTAWRRTLRIPRESPFWADLERLLDRAEGKA